MLKWFLSFLGTVGDFLSALLRRGVRDLLDAILPIALDAVREVAADPSVVTNEDKRNAAFDRIKDRAIDAGLNVGTSLINTAIELAVQKYKAEYQ